MKNILCNELFIFDLDGVVYEGNRPLVNSIDTLCKLSASGKKVAFFSNNATRTPAEFAEKISLMGYKCSEEQVFTSAFVCGSALRSKDPEGARAFVIGENGLLTALKSNSFKIINCDYTFDEIIENGKITAEIVAVGLDREVSYKKFAAASQLIARGASFYASNTDASLPDVHGFLPGAGSLVSFMQTASGRAPNHVFGKPDPEGIFQILRKFGVQKENSVMVGDRLDTDIICGKNAGIHTALSLTGITSAADLIDSNPERLPDWILPDLSAIFNFDKSSGPLKK